MTTEQTKLGIDQEGSTASSQATAKRRPWFDALSAVARRKLNAPPEWEWYNARVIGSTHDTLVTGGIPHVGKRGRARWSKVASQECVVLRSEIDAACDEYERETGNCVSCAGSGETVASVSVANGTTYRVCRRCSGSGRASEVAP